MSTLTPPRARSRAYAALLGLLAVVAGDAAVAASTGRGCFRVLDGTLYAQKPDLTAHRIERAWVPHVWNLWRDDEPRSELPRREAVRDWVRAIPAGTGILVVDLEWWPTRGTRAELEASSERYVQLLEWIRADGYAGLLGYYAVPPVSDYWRAIRDATSSEHRAWKSDNDAFAPLALAVDALFPSLYTFYEDADAWQRVAIANIREARRLARGRPVYPFIWPQYHDSNRALGLRPVPAEYWRRQLRVLREHADGVVIWGGWDFERNRPAAWDPDAAWWRVTREFIAQTDVCAPTGSIPR